MNEHGSMDRLNILVVMSDQHNARVSGPYGDTLVQTPNMARLAREGMVLERCYTPSPVCVPARMSFVSGRRPSENQVTDNPDILSSGILTWPARLSEYGYHTALVGRMHFQGPDQWHGFETTWEDLRHWRNGRPVRHQDDTENVPHGGYWSPRTSIEQIAGSGKTFVHYRDEVVCERGLTFLREEAAKQRDGSARPFAAVIGLYNPHPPYIGPKERFDYYYDKVEVSEERLSSMPDYLAEYYATYRDWENPTPIDSEAKRRALAAYYANVEHVDTQLGRVLDELDRNGLTRNTLVIYTSDHGDFVGHRGAWSKMAMYDDTARVPCIVRLPGSVEAGSRTDHPLNLRDFGNTFCEIAGAPAPAGSDAPSRWGLFTGRGDAGPAETESEIVQAPTPFGQSKSSATKMIVRPPWKLWCYQIGSSRHVSLFNLEDDPGERNDLAGNAELAPLLDELTERLFQGWDPELEITLAAKRRADRAELDKVWMKDWLRAGHGFPEEYDSGVDSPRANALRKANTEG